MNQDDRYESELRFIEKFDHSELAMWILEESIDEFIEDHDGEWNDHLKGIEARKWCVLKYDVTPNLFLCERCKESMELDMPMNFSELSRVTDEFTILHKNCTPEDKLVVRTNEVTQ